MKHDTLIAPTPEGWQLVCSCGYVGRPRKNKFDAGEDEIAHHQTGAGPRTRGEIQDEEAREAGMQRALTLLRRLRWRR